MTDAQFEALAKLLRLRQGPAQDVARLVVVQEVATAEAARAVGMDYRSATYSVKRVKAGLELVRKVVA